MEILKVEAGLIIWELIAFFGLLFVLKRFAWGPLLGILKDREDHIRGSLEKAEETRLEAEKLMEDYKKQLEADRAEAQASIDRSLKFGEDQKEEIIQKAKAEAAEIIGRATADVAREKELALSELRGSVADLAIGAASKVIQQSLTKEANEKLIDQYLAEVGMSGGN